MSGLLTAREGGAQVNGQQHAPNSYILGLGTPRFCSAPSAAEDRADAVRW